MSAGRFVLWFLERKAREGDGSRVEPLNWLTRCRRCKSAQLLVSYRDYKIVGVNRGDRRVCPLRENMRDGQLSYSCRSEW